LEYARNVLGIKEADHEESSPDGRTLLINRLECSLVGQTRKVNLILGSKSAKAYEKDFAIEQFLCNFGLNPAFRDPLFKGPLKVSGVDENGEVRIVEIIDPPFFIATLFLPQLSSTPSEPHPLIISFLKAANTFHNLRMKKYTENAGDSFQCFLPVSCNSREIRPLVGLHAGIGRKAKAGRVHCSKFSC
jgi:CTP synthase (UTP-ammonia lyase)